MTKLGLRPWVKSVLWMLLGVLVGITIYQFFSIKTVKTTPVGTYTCRGGIIQICTGSDEVADYLGV